MHVTPEPCTALQAFNRKCCPTSASPPDIRRAGFPYRFDPTHGTAVHDSISGWAYGGSGYVFSSGLMKHIGREKWKICAERAICGNSDMRVASCIFSHGFTLTSMDGKLGTGKPLFHKKRRTFETMSFHGIRDPESIWEAFKNEQSLLHGYSARREERMRA